MNRTLGKSSVIEGKSLPWLQSSTTSTTVQKKNHKEVVFPIFAYFCSLTTDPFWIDTFTDASYGKFKKGFSLKVNQFIYRKGTRVFTANLTGNIYEDYNIVYNFMKQNGVLSSIDIENRDIQKFHHSETIKKTWAEVKKRERTKIFYISCYANRVIKEMKLPIQLIDQLKTLIHMGLVLNLITDINVVFNEPEILDINNVYYCQYEHKFKINVDRAYQPQQLYASHDLSLSTSTSYETEGDD